ncbi:MAG: hypothetical protein ABL952_03320 [Pyrinomonadaceae bacterium]
MAEEIANRVRGFQPFPASFTFIKKAKLTIWQANLAETTSEASPGTVLVANSDIFEVACGGGSVLKVGEIQPEGKRRMTVRDFLNGAKLEVGNILG